MEGVCTYGKGVYLWKGCVSMEGVCIYRCVPMVGVCTHGRGVYLWKRYLPMEGMCTYGRGVYLWKGCVSIDVYLW